MKAWLILGVALAVSVLIAACAGHEWATPADLFRAIAGATDLRSRLLVEWRIPRVLAAALVGALLGLGGTVFQGVFRNPLAEPYLLGSAGGAALGATVALLVPLAASVTHQLVELLGKQYVDTQRELARTRQQALVAQYVTGPLAEWLAQWPSTGGSAYERLQLALKRIPSAIGQLDATTLFRLLAHAQLHDGFVRTGHAFEQDFHRAAGVLATM